MDIPSVIFWALMAFGLWSRGPAMIYIFFAMQPFGTFAVIPPALLGGVTFTPEWISSGVLAVKVLMSQSTSGEGLAPLFDLRRMGLLSLCTLYAILSAFFLPRLFAGVPVFPVRLVVPTTFPLGPSSANFTQSFYFLLTTVAVLTFYNVARDPKLQHHLLNAILLGACVAVLSGIVDMVAPSALLAPLRTATYALLTSAEVGEGKRVVGFMSEASSYAGVCISFASAIFFLRSSYKSKIVRTFIIPATFLLLILMVALSTSSGGYVALAVIFMLIFISGAFLVLKGRRSGWNNIIFICVGGLGLLAIVALSPDSLSKPMASVNQMVFQKNVSSSYLERSHWNQVTLEAVRDTFGLGVGLGSARASSWPVAVAGNIGLLGAGLLFAFLLRVAFSRPRGGGWQMDFATGAKFALVPILVLQSLSGSSVGFGLMTACLCGIVGAVSWGVEPASPKSRNRSRRGGRKSSGLAPLRPKHLQN